MESEQIFIDYLKSQPINNETINMIKYFESQLKFKKQTIHYKEKITVTLSFIKFIESICKKSNPIVFGSFTRNLIEKIFMSTSETGFGDPINHDIDIVMYDDFFTYSSDKDSFYELISLFKVVSSNKEIKFDFNGYKLIDVTDKTLRETDIKQTDGFGKSLMINIPHFVISLKKDTNVIKYDLLGYKLIHRTQNDTWLNEFNVNTLTLTKNGIQVENKDHWKSYDFHNILNSILNREVVCNINFDSILSGFLNQIRSKKISILNQIIWFLTYRTKILSLGYKDIKSELSFFDLKIERDEICELTGNEPPYIKIKLNCNHYISLMGIIGLSNIRSSDWSESIKCPCCRSDLNLYLGKTKLNQIEIPLIPSKEIIKFDEYEYADEIISEENMNYISHIMNKDSVPLNLPDEFSERNEEFRQSLIGRLNREDYRRANFEVQENREQIRIRPFDITRIDSNQQVVTVARRGSGMSWVTRDEFLRQNSQNNESAMEEVE